MKAAGEMNGASRLADIASELGLSESTVSRAISGKGRVSERTRRAVREYALRRGYEPNRLARGLAQNRTYNICALLPPDAFVSQAPFFQDCLMGICEAASAHGYETIVAVGDVATLGRMTRGAKADGYILMRAVVDDPALELMRAQAAPFVLIGSCGLADVVCVDAENAGECRRLTGRLLRGGCRRPALLLGDESHAVNLSRLEGMRAAIADFGGDIGLVTFSGLTGAEEVADAAERAVAAGADCVFCGDDYICSLAIRRIRALAPELPVASFYGSELLTLAGGNVAAVSIDARALGRRAAERLFDIIGGGT